MDKYITLGSYVENTGEPRVSLLDNQMIKMASNDIQDFWQGMTRDPEKAYLHVIALTSINWYSCNNNGDAFTEEDLIKCHPTFVSDANLFFHHKNKDPEKSAGKPIMSFYNENMHRVELIIAVDKYKAPDLVHSIKNDEEIQVSMGCRVKYDICSICGNKAKNRAEYCEHLRYNLKKILKDGRQVFAINPNPVFFDLSIVKRGADKTAFALQKIASNNLYDAYDPRQEMSSAERGEYMTHRHEKLAAISKLGDMLKNIDAQVIKTKDMDMPELSYDDMVDTEASPSSLLHSILSQSVAPSLGEMAFISGRHAIVPSEDFSEVHSKSIIDALPQALKMLSKNPDFIDSAIEEILSSNTEDNIISVKAIKAIKPIAEKRIIFIKNIADPCDTENMEKAAAEALSRLPSPYREDQDIGLTNVNRIFNTGGPGLMTKYKVRGEDGKMNETTRVAAMAARTIDQPPRLLQGSLGAALGLAALATGFSDAKLTEKLLLSPVLAALSAGVVMSNKSAPQVETVQGAEIPVSSAFSEVAEPAIKEAMEKIAGSATYLASAFGAAVPAALGVDYLYNKHIKHKNNPYFEQQAEKSSKALHTAGHKVVEHPGVAMTTGALTGSALKHLIKAKLKL